MSQKQDSNNKGDTWLVDLYDSKKSDQAPLTVEVVPESDGPKGLEPTRYGDWEKSGRCIDF